MCPDFEDLELKNSYVEHLIIFYINYTSKLYFRLI